MASIIGGVSTFAGAIAMAWVTARKGKEIAHQNFVCDEHHNVNEHERTRRVVRDGFDDMNSRIDRNYARLDMICQKGRHND